MELGEGRVVRVNGPVVDAAALQGVGMLDLVEVGARRLPGEVIALAEDRASIQIYESASGLRPGDPVRTTGGPLTAELGPGLLGGVFDGMLRSLADAGERLDAGASSPTLSRQRRWEFGPAVRAGEAVAGGGTLGRVQESAGVEHPVLLAPQLEGTVEWIAPSGRYRVDEPIARVDGCAVTMAQRWPVRAPRPVRARLEARRPLTTGQRALDLLFPVAHGSTAAVPGGFGTGKTLLLEQVAKWCDASVIVYVGCGERGNELADILHEFAELEDPRGGHALLARTVVIANTSNMPVLAREASVHSGVCVAEYFRDMGHDVVVIADSTSRWAEALREVASRTNELPAEEGYPAGLSAALAAFYERAGRVATLGGIEGSVTILGAVSPPGGDLSEPVTAHTRRLVRSVWSLDRELAYARHYPAVSWHDSSSRDVGLVATWQDEQGDGAWAQRRQRALRLLLDADRLESIVELVGAESLPAGERVVLLTARLLREGVLQQSAVHPNDQYSTRHKQGALLRLVLDAGDCLSELVERGLPVERIEMVDLAELVHARTQTPPDDAAGVEAIRGAVIARLERLGATDPPG